jgi:hypothetical protein
MRAPTYRYNAISCCYEPSRITFSGAFVYALGLAVTSVFFLAGLVILHDFLIDSEREIALLKENNALERHEEILGGELQKVEVT